jgi:Domain of Unknown Function (DUF1080)
MLDFLQGKAILRGFKTMKQATLMTVGMTLGLLGACLVLPPVAKKHLVYAAAETRAEGKGSILGRWDLTVQGADGAYPSWLEVRLSGRRTLVGSFVGQFGSVRPISRVEFDGDNVRFSVPPQWEDRDSDLRFRGRLKDDTLQGETNDAKGGRLLWTGRRAPSLKREQPPKWGKPIKLFNGKDLDGWKLPHASGKLGWRVQDGVLVNAMPGNNLMTEKKFTDFKLHAEFRIPKGSNSGIYLRGRYEVQIEDNWNEEPECHKVGGIYGFLTPSVNPAKKAGEWQTFDITLVGRVVTILFNEERIIDRQTIPGITGGALDSDEGSPGPILLQGDHGPVEFRKLTLTPADG